MVTHAHTQTYTPTRSPYTCPYAQTGDAVMEVRLTNDEANTKARAWNRQMRTVRLRQYSF